ncbi:MAG: hypothetical protein WA919_10230 [Coleofasciculaceae cyanobacterium]
MAKDYARLSITVPLTLKQKLEALGEFPYKSVTNAAVVLMTEALAAREGQAKLMKDQIIEALTELEENELAEVALKALQKMQLKKGTANQLLRWVSQQSEIPLKRLEAIQAGTHMTTKELEKLARVLKTTPPEVKKLLQGQC